MNRSIFIAVAMLELSALGASLPVTQPSTQPTAASLYAVLKTRSIFMKGNQTIASDSNPGRTGRTDGLQGVSGSKLVFNGVIYFGNDANAMIEDTGTNKVSLVREGDLIAAGKVSAISFDDLTYEAEGQQKHVPMGQNMDGVIPTATASTPTTMPTGGSDGAVPAAAAPLAAGSGASPEEILARMKAKRNQEMGIK